MVREGRPIGSARSALRANSQYPVPDVTARVERCRLYLLPRQRGQGVRKRSRRGHRPLPHVGFIPIPRYEVEDVDRSLASSVRETLMAMSG